MRETTAVPTWFLALLIGAVALLLLLIWTVKRRRRPRMSLEAGCGVDELMESIAGLTQGTIVGGNAVRLLQNGEFFDVLLGELRQARETINFETFLSKRGEVTRRLTDVLEAKARDGVKVRLLLDGTGGRRFGRGELRRLRAAGVQVAKYHPFRISNLGRLNNRDHRKIVVIDGRIGFIGGHCLVDSWLGNADDKEHFRDITVRVEGPVVAQLQSAFSENWIEETGDVTGGPPHFPRLEGKGDVDAHVVFVSPAGSPSAVELLHYLAIRAAEKRITIQNPYFLPDRDAREALIEAVQRGVEVRVMIPDAKASDAPFVQHASHHHYGTLLKGGVRIFDYQKTLLHQKIVTVDGCWSAVGSTNFDNRSFEVNDEVSLVMIGEEVARELEETFERDLRDARERRFDEWSKRPLRHKLLDFLLYLFNEQM